MPGENSTQARRFLSGNWKGALWSYVLLFTVNLLSHLVAGSLFTYLTPFLLIGLPLIFQRSVAIRLSARDTLLGIIVSLVFLVPLSAVVLFTGRVFVAPSLSVLAFQLMVISFPEEVFFRGFLQESLGNDTRALVITSLLFSIAHFPRTLLNGEWLPLLAFFPSLVMGWLYHRTGNILPGTVFHFLANVLFIGFAGGLP